MIHFNLEGIEELEWNIKASFPMTFDIDMTNRNK